MSKANRDKINEVKKELLDMYPEFAGFINHTLVATMCFEYHQTKLKNNGDLGAVSKTFAVGKEVKILLNKHGHEFKIGEKVWLINQENDGSWEATNGTETWWIKEYEANIC